MKKDNTEIYKRKLKLHVILSPLKSIFNIWGTFSLKTYFFNKMVTYFELFYKLFSLNILYTSFTSISENIHCMQ